jgi:hypothetical protein
MDKYTDPKPDTDRGRVRTALMQLYREHERSGMLPTSNRFLFYELIMQEVIDDDTKYPTQLVSTCLTQLRQRGLISWDDIVDETRDIDSFTGSATVAQDWLRYLAQARLDPWHRDIPFVITESRSLAGVLRGLVRRYRAHIASTNGQTGEGFLRRIARYLRPGVRIGYLGDLDLAGGQIEANTRRVLERLIGGSLQWQRLAITPQQVRRHRLHGVPRDDKRYNEGRGQHQAVETEALSQALIVNIVERWLKDLLPQPLEPLLQREQRERIRLRRLIEKATRRQRRT